VGRSYGDIVQDMVDYYAYCQYDGAQGGGWRYSCNQFPDNSANQWAAIGLIAAEENFGATVPQIVKDSNEVWINYSQHPSGAAGTPVRPRAGATSRSPRPAWSRW
jgi:hypothetical protein